MSSRSQTTVTRWPDFKKWLEGQGFRVEEEPASLGTWVTLSHPSKPSVWKPLLIQEIDWMSREFVEAVLLDLELDPRAFLDNEM